MERGRMRVEVTEGKDRESYRGLEGREEEEEQG